MKIIKSINLVGIIFLFTLLHFWSCSKDGDSPFEVSVNTSNVSVDAETSKFDLTIASNGEWVVSTDVSWLQSNVRSGQGNQNITITVSDNVTDESRIGVLRVSKKDGKPDDISASVSVVQAQKDVIEITGDIVQTDWKGGDYELNYKDNVQTNIVIPDNIDWIHIVQPSGTRSLTSHKVILKIDENNGPQRKCVLKLIGGNASKELSVNQDAFIGLESIQLTPNEIQITNTDAYIIKAAFYPDNASDKELEWSIEGDGIIAFEGDDAGIERSIVATKNGTAKVNVLNPKSGLVASVNVNVKVKAERIKVTNPPYGYVDMGWDCSFGIGYEVEPSIAYTDDIRITSTNDNVAEVDGKQVVSHAIDGNANIIIELPYSEISTLFNVRVQKVYAQAAGLYISVRNGYSDIELGGKLTSQNSGDIIKITGLYLVDDNGYMHFDNHEIINNNSAYVTWKSTGLRLNYNSISDSIFDYLSSTWYYVVTYRYTHNGVTYEEETTNIYINFHSWGSIF